MFKYSKQILALFSLMLLIACQEYKPNINLQEAVQMNKPKAVKALLKQGVYVNEQDDDGNSTLMLASITGNPKITKMLLDAGSLPNKSNKDGETALTLAAKQGNEKIVRLLIKAGADINAKNDNNDTSFTIAIENHHPAVVKELIKSGLDLKVFPNYLLLIGAANMGEDDLVRFALQQGFKVDGQPEPNSPTALMRAAANGYTKVVRTLIDAGADVNKTRGNNDARNALYYASLYGHADTVKTLLNAGATVETKSVLSTAAEKGYVDTLTLLLNSKSAEKIDLQDNPSVIASSFDPYSYIDLSYSDEVRKLASGFSQYAEENFSAIYINKETLIPVERKPLEVAKLMLKVGENPNLKDERGNTPLILASYEGNSDLVALLLEHKADVNSVGFQGQTPLMAASYKGNVNIVRTLLTNGANCNIQDKNGYTALMYAGKSGSLDVVKELLNAHADVNQKNTAGENALSIALSENKEQIIELLVENKATISPKSKVLNGLFRKALENNNLETVKTAIKMGVDVNQRYYDLDNETPLIVAAKKGYVGIMKELLAAGAKKNATNKFDCTALIEAVQEEQVEAVKLLLSHKARLEDENWSALGWACGGSENEEAQVTIVQLLLDAGANVNYVERSGDTPLTYAAFYGKKKVVSLLLKRGANPRKYTRSGNALQIAQYANVELFRSRGVHGMASKQDYEETIRILAQAMQ